MKILKNKTYKDLLLKIEVLESDKVKLQNKCDEIQIELNMLEQRYILLRSEIDELQSKLSRKGLGKKGSKKENNKQ